MSGIIDNTSGAVARASFAALLRHWRKRAELSQAQLAMQLGYHHSVISRWESGAREPSLRLVKRLDEVLGTGGMLAQLMSQVYRREADLVELHGLAPHSPLPGGVVAGFRGLVVWEMSGWPARLPYYGLTCPLHGLDGCDVPPPERALVLYTSFTTEPSSQVDDEIIHVLAAQLAVYARLAEEHGPAELCTAVEAALHVIVTALRSAEGRTAHALLHLAATYAGLAGEQRMLRGQHAAAMALFGRGLHWAMLCDDLPLRVALMCDMSTLARLENDGVSALTYAQALQAIDHDRTWISTLAHLYEARGYAMLTDVRETTSHINLARGQLARLTEQDQREAIWMSGIHGQVLVESGTGGALRDIAAAMADRSIARSAITATEQSLPYIPSHLRPSRVLMTLRLADCYACAGEPEAAVAIATPVLAEAVSIPAATVRQELRGLRSRLAARWPTLGPVRDFLARWHG